MTEREALAVRLWNAGVLRMEETGRLPLRFVGEKALEGQMCEDILDALAELIRDHYASADCVLGGAWAERISLRLGLPLGLQPGARCPLVVTDTVTDGTELHALTAPIRESGASVAIAAVFSYGLEEAHRRLDKADVRLHWLTDLENAAAAGLQEGIVDFEEYEQLMSVL